MASGGVSQEDTKSEMFDSVDLSRVSSPRDQFQVGEMIEIFGINSKPEWNGKHGIIIGEFINDRIRWPVSILDDNYNCGNPDNDHDIKTTDIDHDHTNSVSHNSNLNSNDKNKQGTTTALLRAINLKLLPGCFKIASIDKRKGQGWIATRDIKMGTLIHTEKPLVTLGRNIKTRREIFDIVNALPPSKFKAFKALHDKRNNEDDVIRQSSLAISSEMDETDHDNENENDKGTDKDKDEVIDIMEAYFITNTNYVEISNKESGVFEIISRINHSCIGNAGWVYSQEFKCMLVISEKDIKKNEEIVVPYVATLDIENYQQRQAMLLKKHNFYCKCESFCGNQTVIKKSDLILKRYHRLKSDIKNTLMRLMNSDSEAANSMNNDTNNNCNYDLEKIELNTLKICQMQMELCKLCIDNGFSNQCLFEELKECCPYLIHFQKYKQAALFLEKSIDCFWYSRGIDGLFGDKTIDQYITLQEIEFLVNQHNCSNLKKYMLSFKTKKKTKTKQKQKQKQQKKKMKKRST